MIEEAKLNAFDQWWISKTQAQKDLIEYPIGEIYEGFDNTHRNKMKAFYEDILRK